MLLGSKSKITMGMYGDGNCYAKKNTKYKILQQYKAHILNIDGEIKIKSIKYEEEEMRKCNCDERGAKKQPKIASIRQ